MAREVYRVEIPIVAEDQYSSTIRQAEQVTSQFEKRMERTASRVKKRQNDINNGRWSVTIRAVDHASRVVSKVSSYINRVANRGYRFTLRAYDMASRAIGGVRRALTSIPAMVTVALSVIGANKLKDATVGAAMNFEQYEVSMTHWLDGNTKKAKELIGWMGKFADSTPFSSADLFPALSRGVGVADGNVGDAKRMLKISADMAALMPGKTPIEAMEALADARTGEFERMKEFGMKISQEDYKAMGGWSGFLDDAGGRFKDGAKKLSETSLGILMTLKGYQGALFRSMGDGILKPMKPRLDAINDWLANNQDTWGRWKDTVKGHGKQASEFVFSNLAKGFNHVQSRYLNNKEFMDLSFKGKVAFVMDDINGWWNGKGKKALDGWWEGTGKPWASKIGLSVGEAIFEGMKTGLLKGLETLTDIWSNAFENPSMKSLGGAGAATLGVGAIGAMLLNPLFQLGKVIAGIVTWIANLIPGVNIGSGGNKGGKGGKGGGGTPVVTSGKPSDGKTKDTKGNNTGGNTKKTPGPVIVDQHGRPISSQPPKPSNPKPTPTPKVEPKPSGKKPSSKTSKQPDTKVQPNKLTKFFEKFKIPGIEKMSKFTKGIPLLSTFLGAAAIMGAPEGEKAKTTGGVAGAIAGGTAGAAGGAALGSVVPIIGNIVGGIIGLIGGSIAGAKGGEVVGDWFGNQFFSGKDSSPKGPGGAVDPGGSAPTSDGMPGQMFDFAEMNQHAQTLTASLSGMSSKVEAASHNIEAITMTLGESAGWVAGAFYPLQGATEGLTHNIDALTMTIGESAGWMAGAFYPLQGATEGLVHNISAMTMVTGEASGWIVGSFYPLQGTTEGLVHNISAMTMVTGEASGWIVSAFYPLQGTTEGLVHNISAITMTLGESAGWIAGAFYPLSGAGAMLTQNTSALGITLGESTAIVASSYLPLAGSGAMVNQNTMALGMVLGLSSAVVAGAYMPLAGAGPMLTGNTMALAMTLGMASGWVASLNGIQAGAAAVKGALSNLAARIASVPTPSVSVGGGGRSAPSAGKRPGGPKAYAKGGFINHPHLGLVGEAGPEMIIPLSSGRRGRAMELFNQTASMLGVRPYADGGLAGLEPILPGYGESEQPTLSLAGSMAGTVKNTGGTVHVSAPISVEFSGGGQTDEKMIRDIVVNYSREFVEKLREALNNMSR